MQEIRPDNDTVSPLTSPTDPLPQRSQSIGNQPSGSHSIRQPVPTRPYSRLFHQQLRITFDLLRWIPIAAVVGIMAGTASALLLVSLDWATRTREAHIWIVALLPVAGLAVGLLYWWVGTSVEAGNNLILEEIHAEARAAMHDPNAVIPIRMTPLILLGTVITHLFGGSAGREGTAIQTGASLADQICRPLHGWPFFLSGPNRRIVLMMGISAGFASVFGTPLAGTIFGLEVLALGTVAYDAFAPCLMAAFVGEMVTRAWGVHHTLYTVTAVPQHMNLRGLASAMAAGVAFGLMAMAFSQLTHRIKKLGIRLVPWPPLRPFFGGALVAATVFSIGTTHTMRFLGLGISEIVAAFHQPLPPTDFAVKALFTSLTLGAGFKGGEVTPLFFIGATMGNALSHILPLPPGLLAGMGFVAVFAGAANTPIASTLMACELFGTEAGVYAGIACVLSYLFSGHSGIYTAQRIGRSKHRAIAREEGLTLGGAAQPRSEAPD
jgi:H+/Cl- antiporter ClcA